MIYPALDADALRCRRCGARGETGRFTIDRPLVRVVLTGRLAAARDREQARIRAWKRGR